MIRSFVDNLITMMHDFNSDYSSVFKILMDVEGDENFEDFNFSEKDLEIIKKLVDCSAPYDIYLFKRKPQISIEKIEKLRSLGSGVLSQLGLS